MIETKAQVKRKVRDTKIMQLFALYYVEQKSLKSAAAEKIARDLKTSVTTVNRIVKANSIEDSLNEY